MRESHTLTMQRTGIQTLELGKILAERWRVDSVLGRGGQGEVYLGTQMRLDRKVAIKTLNPRSAGWADSVARFRREAAVIQTLTHPNTIRLYDTGTTDDSVLYIVMEYLEGRPLNTVLEENKRLPIQVVQEIAEQLLGALMEAHSKGVIHRDIKPSNIYLCRQVGAPYFVKLLDFGLARAQVGEVSLETSSGAVMGTPHYMSPEQALGERVDARCDLYSLALTLFELAVGRPAYDGKTAAQLLIQHISEEPLRLPPGLVGTPLGEVIRLAANRWPHLRPPSAAAMLEELTGEPSLERYSLESGLDAPDLDSAPDTLDVSISVVTPPASGTLIDPTAPTREDRPPAAPAPPPARSPLGLRAGLALSLVAVLVLGFLAFGGGGESTSDDRDAVDPGAESTEPGATKPEDSNLVEGSGAGAEPPQVALSKPPELADTQPPELEPSEPSSDPGTEQPVVAEPTDGTATEVEPEPAPERRRRRRPPTTDVETSSPAPERTTEPSAIEPAAIETAAAPEPDPEQVESGVSSDEEPEPDPLGSEEPVPSARPTLTGF